MKFSIARLLLSSAGALIIVAVGLSLWMSVQVNQLDELGHQLEHLSAARETAQELRYHTAQIQQFYTDASLTGEQDAADEGHQHFQQANDKLASMKKLAPEMTRELDALRNPIEQLDSVGMSMFKAYSSSGKDAGDQVMRDFDARSAAVIQGFASLQAPLEMNFNSAQQQSEEHRESLKFNTLLAWTVALAVILGTLWLIHVRVLPPLRRMTRSLHELNNGRGDLSRVLRQDGDDEISAVVVEFNQFVAALREQIVTIAEVGQTLDHSSEQLVCDAEAAEQSAEMLRVEIEQIATAVNQMAATVQGVASNAQASSSQTGDANREAQAAIHVVNTTISDIRTLADEVDKAAGVIQELESHSREIGGVLEVIRTIAEQTNLLALNAAIEAARAGEQGRGFAVVADEVRTLASRTQASTQEIQSMIERLQGASQQAVKVMHESRGFAENGVTQAESAGQALHSISALVASVSEMSQHIAEAAREQSTVSDELSRRTTSVADVAGRTVELSENTLARGRAAGENAHRLGEIVGQFKF